MSEQNWYGSVKQKDSRQLTKTKELTAAFANMVEVERKLLSILISNPTSIVDVANDVIPDYFYEDAHRIMYEAMLAVYNNSKSPDFIFSHDALYYKNTNIFLFPEFIASVQKFQCQSFTDYYNLVASVDYGQGDLKTIVDLIKEAGTRMQIYAEMRKSQLSLVESVDVESVDDIVERTTKNSLNILAHATTDRKLVSIGGDCGTFLTRIRSRIENGEELGISTGFLPLDNAINMLQKGNLYVFAARPKTGKSTMLLKLASNIAQKNIPVLYIDTELNTEQEVVPRLLSMYARVNNYWIINGTFVRHPEELSAVEAAAEKVATLPLFHIYRPGIKLNELVSLIKLWILRHVGTVFDHITGQNRVRDCVVVFDYLKVTQRSVSIKDYQLLGEMTTVLKDLAGQYGFPCITAVQNNRNSVREMDGNVVNAELAVANSDEILQYANYLFFLDKIRSYRHITNGFTKGLYCSYREDYQDDKMVALFNSIMGESDSDVQESKLSNLFGNRILSLVAGRQNGVHEDNSYLTLSMDFKFANVGITGELANQFLGKEKKRTV